MGRNCVYKDSSFRSQQITVLLELLRSGIFGKLPDISCSVNVDWDFIWKISIEQGILGWVWDGICNLPVSDQPSRQLKINWALSADEISTRYNKQKKVLDDIINICGTNGIRVLLLKGIGLSELYRSPHRRPSGDIDIFLFDQFEKGNSLLSSGNLIRSGKHAEFDYDGVLIENHEHFLNLDWGKRRRIEDFIFANIDNSILTSTGYYILEPQSNFLYILMHATRHLNYDDKGLSLRTIMDIPLFLIRYQDVLTPDVCYQLTDKFKVSHCFELFVYLGEWILGINLSHYHRGLVPKSDLDAAYDMFVMCNNTKYIPREASYFEYLKIRVGQIKKGRWKYHYEHVNIIKRLYIEIKVQINVLVKYLVGVGYGGSLREWLKKRKEN